MLSDADSSPSEDEEPHDAIDPDSSLEGRPPVQHDELSPGEQIAHGGAGSIEPNEPA